MTCTGKQAASSLLKLFVNGNERCHTPDAIKILRSFFQGMLHGNLANHFIFCTLRFVYCNFLLLFQILRCKIKFLKEKYHFEELQFQYC